ncbi:MAG: UDP-N-acetylmuramoyl-L-alanyl-D-glutamate--2,6-diaminopimelate ligase [Bacteroidaceae bacterium]|nr:UDP-N-acetylmuramoyl-L-alanyl-D-glutamate--2,6-diaminopimelate ligase [Bacteroidaceae bacterium]
MKLSEILNDVKVLELIGSAEREVCDVVIDSRKVVEGSLFVAIPGTQVDGHTFIPMAIEKGAKTIVCSTLPATLSGGVTYVHVDDCEEAVGHIATAFNHRPTERLTLVGVTGTNGKTTIATLLYKMFRAFGYKVGLVSTVCNYIDDEAVPADHTTPDAVTLNNLLGRMADAGCTYAFMECSSHAIDQKRISGLRFAGGIFTNLTRDHMDYHKTVENYLRAKKAFFDGLPAEAFMITNLDDKNGLVMAQNTRAHVYTYSQQRMCDFKGRILEHDFDGMLLDINNTEVFVQFVGKFNASNLLAVYGAACALGREPMEVLTVLSTLRPVSGRFEAIRSPKGFSAIVDYAHTPDAINNVLRAINEVVDGKAEVITVVGAGGNRDKGKRPIMAQEAVKGSTRVIITSDNPRFEEPQDIINDMLAGLTDEERKKVLTIVDRREAIRTACLIAHPGDVILVAGKGHEDYQEVKGVKHHFDDREVLREEFGLTKG